MKQLNQQQKDTLTRFYPELRTYFAVEDLKEKKPDLEPILLALVSKIESVKGEKGDMPVKGEDYFTDEEIQQFLDKATPIKGIHYDDGKDGYTPIKNKDYFDGKDGKTPKKGIDYDDGKDGYTPVKGKDFFDGKDGNEIEPEEIVHKLHSLPEGKRLGANYIDGLSLLFQNHENKFKNLLNNGKKLKHGKSSMPEDDPLDQRWHGGGSGTNTTGVTQIIAGNNITISPTNGQGIVTINSSGGGSSGYQLPTGTVNGTNKTFVFATAPNAITVDGATLQQTEQGGTVNWTGTTTVVLLVAPTQSVFAVA